MSKDVQVIKDGQTLFNGPAQSEITVTVAPGDQNYSRYREKRLLWTELDSIEYAIFGSRIPIPDGWGEPYPPTKPPAAMKDFKKNDITTGISVRPNPFSTNVDITFSMQNANIKFQNAKLKIINTQGKILHLQFAI
jgi:hypothetical protein